MVVHYKVGKGHYSVNTLTRVYAAWTSRGDGLLFGFCAKTAAEIIAETTDDCRIRD
jgi:hypothetical protein